MTTPSRPLSVLILGAASLVAWVIAPFATPLLLAAVFAGGLAPLHQAIARRVGGHRTVAALLIVLGLITVVALPVAGLATIVVRESSAGLTVVSELLRGGERDGLLARLPAAWQGKAGRLLDQLAIRVAAGGGWFSAFAGSGALATLGNLTGTAMGFVLRTVLMLVALAFLLVDGHGLVPWLEAQSPLARGQLTGLLGEFRRVSVAIIRSSLLTALVQAITALLGFLLARAPQPLFFAFAAFLLALIPAVGAAGGSLLVSLIVLAQGRPLAALFLAGWSLGVVGLVDNVVKPLFIRGGLDLHPAIIFFALLGGLAAFGPVGLLVGPLSVALLLAVLRLRSEAVAGRGALERLAELRASAFSEERTGRPRARP
jgi:predicted PurR-regulated permease PerM